MNVSLKPLENRSSQCPLICKERRHQQRKEQVKEQAKAQSKAYHADVEPQEDLRLLVMHRRQLLSIERQLLLLLQHVRSRPVLSTSTRYASPFCS